MNWNYFAIAMGVIALFVMWALCRAWQKTNPQPDDEPNVHPANTSDLDDEGFI